MLQLRSHEADLMRALSPPLRRLLWLSGVLYAVYLIAGNLFLNSTLAANQINRQPETFHAQWAWAWTLWPGQLHAHDLVLRGHARQLLWSASGDDADGRIQLWPLFRRELRFGPVVATAVAIDVQTTKVDHKPPAWNSDAWRITAERVSTRSLRQLRMNEWVVEGAGAGETGFTHQLRGGATRIFPSRIGMTRASLHDGALSLLHDARFELHFAADPFTHEQPPGWRKLERATARLTLEGMTPTVALGASHAGAKAVALSPLDGHLSADLSLDHGTLAPGGRLQWNAPVAITDADGTQQRRRGQLDVAVQPDGVAIHARIPPPPGVDAAKAMNQLEVQLLFASRRLLPMRSMDDNLRLLSGSGNARWHFASLSWLTPLIASKPWLHLDGDGDIDAALRLDAGRLAPGSRIDVPRVDVRAGILDNVFAGSARGQAQITRTANGAAQTEVGLIVDRFTLAPQAVNAAPYLRGRALTVAMQSSADLAQLRDTLIAHVHFANADVPDLRAYNRYLPGKSLYFLGGSGRMNTDLTVDGKGDVSAGQLQMNSTGTRLALGVSRLSGNLRMDTRLALATRAGHAFDLDHFSLNMDGVRVDGSRDPPWWARFTIEHGHLDWDRPMRLRGSASMVMKDVSLLLSLFADRSAFPKWITQVINDGQATAHAQVEAQRGDFVLDQLVASNQRVDLFAHLRVRDGKPSGDLYARWGIFGLGVALTDGKREFHLLHARRWYQAQPDLLAPITAAPASQP